MQEQIVRSALDGKDVLAILPTGGGKSVCFQVPGLMTDGIALVITPLIALMKDQVQNLRNRGVKALAIYAGMNRREVEQCHLRRCEVPVSVSGEAWDVPFPVLSSTDED